MDFLTDPFLIPKETFGGSVLITGASGCIGSWVAAILHRSGVSLIAADLKPDHSRAGLILGKETARTLNWQRLDVTDGEAVKNIVAENNVQAIIHLAGLQIPFCAANPSMGAQVNVVGTVNILEAARASNVQRTVFASSVAAVAFPAGGPYKETLYGAYKVANEQTAAVYWNDWNVPTVCLRPNVIYGVGRDQGMSSKSTIAIQAAVLGEAYEVTFSGRNSWLYTGEGAAAFIASVSQDGDGAHTFNFNGPCAKIEEGLDVIKSIEPSADVTCSGDPFPFPPDMDDGPLRAHVPSYPSISLEEGIRTTFKAFKQLKAEGRLPALPA